MTASRLTLLIASLMLSASAAHAQTPEPAAATPAPTQAATAAAAQPADQKPATEPATAAPAAEQPTAQPASQDVSLSGGRTLNGHTFMPSEGTPGPFVTTSFASAMLLGIGTTTSSLTIAGIDLSKDLQYAGTGGVLGYEYSFLEHFSVRAKVSTIIYSGITGRAALAIGTTVQVGFAGGATASIPIGKTARVALLFDLSNEPNVALTVGAAARAILASCAEPGGCSLDAGSVINLTKVTSYRPAFAAGWSPWKPLGVSANLGTTIATAPDFETGVSLNFGLTVDFDFHPLWKVPVGLQLAADGVFPVTGNTIVQTVDLGGGIYYTGRQDLAVGVQIVARRFAVTQNVDVSWSTVLANIGMRYYW